MPLHLQAPPLLHYLKKNSLQQLEAHSGGGRETEREVNTSEHDYNVHDMYKCTNYLRKFKNSHKLYQEYILLAVFITMIIIMQCTQGSAQNDLSGG